MPDLLIYFGLFIGGFALGYAMGFTEGEVETLDRLHHQSNADYFRHYEQ